MVTLDSRLVLLLAICTINTERPIIILSVVRAMRSVVIPNVFDLLLLLTMLLTMLLRLAWIRTLGVVGEFLGCSSCLLGRAAVAPCTRDPWSEYDRLNVLAIPGNFDSEPQQGGAEPSAGGAEPTAGGAAQQPDDDMICMV
jgi:hypothetical protein